MVKLISDSCSDHFLFIPFFGRTPRCRDIDCKSLVKISEILVGADILSMSMICDFLAWRASTVREEVRPYKLAGRLQLITQLLHKEETSSSEESTSESRESQLLLTLTGQNSKKMLHWSCI